MKTSGQHAFVNQLLVYTLVVFCLSGTAGLSTVWLRHQMSVTADQTRQHELRLAEVDRRLAEVGTFIAAEQSPDVLARRNQDMRLGLVMPRETQVLRVAVSPERRLASQRNAEISAAEDAFVPVRFVLPPAPTRRP